MASFHDVAGEMGAGDQIGVAHVFHGAFERTRNTGLGQLIAHLLGALRAARPGGAQTFEQGGVGVVKAQADDVHRGAHERNRNLGAGEKGQALLAGGGHGTVQSAGFIVVGQRPQLHAVGFGSLGELFGGQCAVGHDGVAVEIGVDKGVGHGCILGLTGSTRVEAWQIPWHCGAFRPEHRGTGFARPQVLPLGVTPKVSRGVNRCCANRPRCR